MFNPVQTIVQQGSFGATIAWFVRFSAAMELAGTWAFFGLVAVQLATLVTTWWAAPAPIARIDLTVGTMALAALAGLLYFAFHRENHARP